MENLMKFKWKGNYAAEWLIGYSLLWKGAQSTVLSIDPPKQYLLMVTFHIIHSITIHFGPEFTIWNDEQITILFLVSSFKGQLKWRQI